MNMDINLLYKTAFNSANEGLIMVNKTGEIVEVNVKTIDMFGYSKEELVGQKVEVLMASRYQHSHVSTRDAFQKKPTPRAMSNEKSQLYGMRKDGVEIPINISLNLFVIDGVHFVLALISDVTKSRLLLEELKSAKDNLFKLNLELENLVIKRTKELRKSQKLYQLIAQSFPNGIINVLNTNYQFVFAEGKDLKNRGIKAVSLIGTSFLDQFNAVSKAEILEKLELVCADNIQSLQVKIEERYYELNIIGLVNSDNVVDQILIVQFNISQLKKHEIEQERALLKERELGVMKSRFVSMASHEFRTPLSAILSSTSLIEKYEKEEQQDKRLRHTERIKSSVNNLTNILNDFLSFDKLSSGNINVTVEEFDLLEAIESALDEIQVLKKKGQEFVVVKESLGSIESDPKLLKNVVINLVSNAIKYSKDDSEIEIKVFEEKEMIHIEVKDSGIGIPEDEQKKMFQRFFRAGNVSNIQGTGLGLNIVKKYVELLKGDITFESKLNVGSTFIVTLPKNIRHV